MTRLPNRDHLHSATSRKPLSLRYFITAFFKRKRLILSVFFAVFVIGALTTFLMSPVFLSEAKILVERKVDSEKAVLLNVNGQPNDNYYNWINSELEILTSYPVAERLVKELGLLERERGNRTLTDEENSALFQKVVVRFREKLDAGYAKDSNVIDLSYQSTDAALAAAVVNNVIATYLEYRSELYDQSDSYAFIEQQLKVSNEKLRELEKEQADYKYQQKLASPKTQADILLAKLAEYEKKLTAVRTKRIGKEAKIRVISKQWRNGPGLSIPATELSDRPSREKFIVKLRSDLLNMEMERNQLLQQFRPTYKGVVTLDKMMVSVKARIKEEIRQIMGQEETGVQVLKLEERELSKTIRNINAEVAGLAEKEFQMEQFSRGIESSREVHAMLLKQREEARISLAKVENGIGIKVISPAVVPTKPIKPRKLLNMLMFVILGVIGGVSLALFLEYNDDSITTVKEVESLAGLKLLGAVRDSLPEEIIIN